MHNVERMPGLARFSLGTARRFARLGAGARGQAGGRGRCSPMARLRSLVSGDLGSLLTKMPPQTRFSGDVSAHRVFEAVGLPLARVQAGPRSRSPT